MSEKGLDRIVSIDVFRGLSIVGMLLTVAPGGSGAVHPQFQHATWVAGTFADFVAPTFMWVVGMSLYFYLKKRRGYDLPTGVLIVQLTQRCVVLFVLGFALVNLPLLFQPSDARYPFVLMGTLQRIAAALLIGGMICILMPARLAWIAASIVIFAIYMSVVALVPVPGFARADFSPDGNVVQYFDRLLLGNHAGRSHPLLSVLGASISVLLGATTATLLDTSRRPASVLKCFFSLGVFLVLCGIGLTYWIPSVMFTWTPSYGVFMAGVSTIAYAVLYWIVEMQGIHRVFYPVTILGLNPIAVLTGQWAVETVAGSKGIVGSDGRWESLASMAFQWFSEPFPTPFLATLVFNIAIIAFWSGLFYLVPFHTWKAKFRSLHRPAAR